MEYYSYSNLATPVHSTFHLKASKYAPVLVGYALSAGGSLQPVVWEPGGRGGGHSPWFWAPTVEWTPGAVVVNASRLEKKGAGGLSLTQKLSEGAYKRGTSLVLQ